MKIEFNTETDSPALLLHIAKFFETTSPNVERRVAPTKPAPINAPVHAPLPELTIGDDDAPDTGAPSTLEEISQLGFGDDTPPQVDPATLGFGAGQRHTDAIAHAEPTQPINTSGVAVDKSNCPHDARIHSSPPKINADGMWRKRKNVDQAEFDLISNQLRGIMQVQPTIAPPPPLPPHVVQAPIAPPPPMLMQLAPPVIQPNAFVQMMSEIAPMLETAGGKLRLVDLEFFARNHGMIDPNGKGQIAMFQNRPDLIPPFMNAVRAHVATII